MREGKRRFVSAIGAPTHEELTLHRRRHGSSDRREEPYDTVDQFGLVDNMQRVGFNLQTARVEHRGRQVRGRSDVCRGGEEDKDVQYISQYVYDKPTQAYHSPIGWTKITGFN